MKKKRKTSLRLSAATYVSKRTKKMQQKIIDEPYTLKIANGRVSSQPSEADKAKLRQKDTELRNLRNELADAKREIENMKLSLQKAERAVEKASRSQQVQSNGPSNVDVSKELARLNRHRDALASILNDYDASTSRLTAAMTGRSHTFLRSIQKYCTCTTAIVQCTSITTTSICIKWRIYSKSC